MARAGSAGRGSNGMWPASTSTVRGAGRHPPLQLGREHQVLRGRRGERVEGIADRRGVVGHRARRGPGYARHAAHGSHAGSG